MYRKFILLICILALVLHISNVYAANFGINGTVYDFNGVALNNTNISVTIKAADFRTDLGTNSTATNATGWFNLTVPGEASDSYYYQLKIIHTNTTFNYVDYVGQTLPMFPYFQFSQLVGVNYYLKEAGTINIYLINSSKIGVPYNEFSYQVKDTKLGYPTGTCSNVGNYLYTCYVPKDRNYSIMVYPSDGSPQHFVPVSYDWNNFTANQYYTIGIPTVYSNYNATTRTLNKTFNVTESYARISGYLDGSIVNANGWSEFTVVPFLSESGNMIFMTYGTMPYNASLISGGLYATDNYNEATGFYNITLPYASSETVRYILFASAKNGTTYYGGYRSITVTGDATLNFTMYGMLGSNSLINQSSFAGGFHTVNTSRQQFRLINGTQGSSNESLSNINAHIEATVDYSNYGAIEFTFMEELSGQNNGNFSLPLINVTGVKEINAFSMNDAPRRIPTKTAAQIRANNNISIAPFNPEALDGTTGASISINIYKSNSTCDVPVPPSDCALTSSSDMSTFNPFSIVMGGGKISFRMGMGSVLVHYVDVDMLASGPPDAMFEDNNDITEDTTDGFSKAMRFGSNGPTIYNYVLISMPYTQGSTSQAGLNESAEVNVSIPTFYDENWNVVWNTSLNGTNATFLSGNISHYSTYKSQWETLMGNNTCVNTSGLSAINSSYPCHIDKTNNRIWLRLPHFSGTGPDMDGDVITTTTTIATTTVPSGGGGGGISSGGKLTKVKYTFKELKKNIIEKWKINQPGMGLIEMNMTVKNPANNVQITIERRDGKPSYVMHEITGKIYQYIEINKTNINDSDVDKIHIKINVNKSWITNNNIDVSTIALNRYVDDAWVKLTTAKESEDSNYVYFIAESPGLSAFAVTGDVKSSVATTTATTSLTSVATTLPTTIAGGETTTIPSGYQTSNTTYALIIILIIIAVAIFFIYRRKA